MENSALSVYKIWATTKMWTETKCFSILVYPRPWIHAICPVFKGEACRPELFSSTSACKMQLNHLRGRIVSSPSLLHIGSYQISLWSILCCKRKFFVLHGPLPNQKLLVMCVTLPSCFGTKDLFGSQSWWEQMKMSLFGKWPPFEPVFSYSSWSVLSQLLGKGHSLPSTFCPREWSMVLC